MILQTNTQASSQQQSTHQIINILNPKTNPLLDVLMQNNVQSNVSNISNQLNPSDFLKNVFQLIKNGDMSQNAIFDMLKNNPSIKSSGTFGENIQILVKMLNQNPSQNSQNINNLLTNIQNLQPQVLQNSLLNSGIFLESNLLKMALGDSGIQDLTKDIKAVLYQLKNEIQNKPAQTGSTTQNPVQQNVQPQNQPNIQTGQITTPNLQTTQTLNTNITQQTTQTTSTTQQTTQGQTTIQQPMPQTQQPNMQTQQQTMQINQSNLTQNITSQTQNIQNTANPNIQQPYTQSQNGQSIQNPQNINTNPKTQNIPLRMENNPYTQAQNASLSVNSKTKSTQTIEQAQTLSQHNQNILNQTEKLIAQVEYFQLLSLYGNGNYFYMPFYWDDLVSGTIYTRKDEDKTYCEIDLELQSYGNIKVMLSLFGKDTIDISFSIENNELKSLLQDNLKLLRTGINKADFNLMGIKIIDRQKNSPNPYQNHTTQNEHCVGIKA